jgi:GDPmannose 4,6-dehydratase
MEESHTVEEFLQPPLATLASTGRIMWSLTRSTSLAEVDNLQGDSIRARKVLKWKPKVGFQQLDEMMVDHDVVIFILCISFILFYKSNSCSICCSYLLR